jgi:hypothetical protein
MFDRLPPQQQSKGSWPPIKKNNIRIKPDGIQDQAGDKDNPEHAKGKYDEATGVYHVEKDDTLYSIAKRFKTSIQDIVTLNPGKIDTKDFKIFAESRLYVKRASHMPETKPVHAPEAKKDAREHKDAHSGDKTGVTPVTGYSDNMQKYADDYHIPPPAIDVASVKLPFDMEKVIGSKPAPEHIIGKSLSDPKSRDTALKTIADFEKNNGTTTVFTKISKQHFAADLRAFVQKPEIVDQKGTNLCGPSVAIKIALEANPEDFVNMTIMLYETGAAANNFGYNIQCNNATYNTDPTTIKWDNGASPGMNSALYIVGGAMRNSENYLGSLNSYSPEHDNRLSGFGWPKDITHLLMSGMKMKETSKKDTQNTPQNNTGLVKDIQEALKAGHAVVLCINDDVFESALDKTSGLDIDINPVHLGPNHYIQVTGITAYGDDRVTVDWWSWGGQQKSLTMTVSHLNRSTFIFMSYGKE